MHFESNPFQRDLFGVQPEEVHGRFSGWQENARYTIAVTVVLQIQTTNVSDAEYNIAPQIAFLSTNQAIINIYKTWRFTGSFKEFQDWYAQQEASLEYYVKDLSTRLNSARAGAGKTGSWYVAYSLNDRDINVSEVSG